MIGPMKNDKQYRMDRAYDRLVKINSELLTIQQRLNDIYNDFKAVREELANAITPAVEWRTFAEMDGIHIPPESDDETDETAA